MDRKNGRDFEFFVIELTGKRRSGFYAFSSAEEAAIYLLNSIDEEDIKKIDDAMNRILKTGKVQFMALDIDCELESGERLKNRCGIAIY